MLLGLRLGYPEQLVVQIDWELAVVVVGLLVNRILDQKSCCCLVIEIEICLFDCFPKKSKL